MVLRQKIAALKEEDLKEAQEELMYNSLLSPSVL